MDVPSHAEVVAQIDTFLRRHKMAPTRLGRDALGEASFVKTVKDGRLPGLATLRRLRDFMREADEQLITTSSDAAPRRRRHRLSAGGR